MVTIGSISSPPPPPHADHLSSHRPRVSDEFIRSLDILFVLMAEPKQTIAKMMLSTTDPPEHLGPYVEGLEPPVRVELDR